ncbi:Hsp20/alpha crystallin family protein [Leptospira sp. 2 VSF19]|uniref:Hsp20/alpha crystallin family protein n=1 Tax=Leptospira soteropolitanensis TaxID=2950025 RepID=A0AAW5VGC8_9LEPT|nr:Hsp20/alpha crystallin family protein [Leptospira soteropolitanensis]MCW7492040.1 Hsp20/alpha crystallin family protein [Leptospira soteropolitanensis]MCW7499622.1 Hsp20/alpha crystallin family protein [Leptospira soteropolitanensis]MCW7521873.1 Hsp20/alpha crystallin family protein [Leptospira soteropolitanensis]MCW7525727.1 Hsp20/alpha crystallin family protein [Leptospira soteropolitanensis]MCW7530159.1 Hsp20/alpha crystallin family protein [Leptospira soteropolitanensis]
MLFRILDPQAKANQFWRDFDRLNDELTRSILDSQFGSASNFPPVNVYTKEDEALVTCLLPGIEPDQIDINVKDNLLSIHGRKKTEELAEGTEVHRREIFNGEFHRTLELPFRVDQDHVLAKYSNGVLNIHLPRREEDKPKKVSIIAG